ncbi:MAG TPA: sulfatase-like hydrolase/transferase, partial [Prosthecobacter sp.]
IGEKASRAKKGDPFFIYMPLNSPHTPILPSEKWQGKSGISLYADFVMETDDAIGQIMRATEEAGIAQDTLIIVTSDNGCSPSADYPKLATFGHNPSGVMRGHKADIYDGGHRVPFIVRWPAKVKADQKSAQLVCLTDFMATAAEIVDTKLPETAAEDSFSFLPALLGQSGKATRQSVIHHSIQGAFALREGDWKLELCAGSGGWSEPRPGTPAEKGLPDTQLYNLASDIAEKNNLQAEKPEIVAKMTKDLEKIVADGRSTPGATQKNAVEVVLRKPVPQLKPKKKQAK